MRFWSALILVFLISGCNHPESKNFERFSHHENSTEASIENEQDVTSYKVIGVKDGDNFGNVVKNSWCFSQK